MVLKGYHSGLRAHACFWIWRIHFLCHVIDVPAVLPATRSPSLHPAVVSALETCPPRSLSGFQTWETPAPPLRACLGILPEMLEEFVAWAGGRQELLWPRFPCKTWCRHKANPEEEAGWYPDKSLDSSAQMCLEQICPLDFVLTCVSETTLLLFPSFFPAILLASPPFSLV